MRPSVALLAGGMLLSTAGTSLIQDYPHAFPRAGATKRFENERVFIWEVAWPNRVEQPYHRHRYDMTGVFLGWGPLRVTRPDGSFTDSTEPFDIPRVFFQGAGVTHKEEGIGTPERHSIMIDLKEFTPPARAPRTDVPSGFPENGEGALIDNDRVRVWDITMRSGRGLPMHYHGYDMVVVVLEGGTVVFRTEDGREERTVWEYKDVAFMAGSVAHSEDVVSGRPHVMVFELK